MTRLSEGEIESYRDLRVASLEKIKGFSVDGLKKLKLLEERIIENNPVYYGLPFHLAHAHHPGGKSIKDLSQELGVNVSSLTRLFLYFNIPRLNLSEARIRYHNNSAFMGKQAEERRRNSERRRANKNKEINVIEEIGGREIARLPKSIPSNVNYRHIERRVGGIICGDVVRAYDEIVTYTENGVGNWKELIPLVSEKTGAELEFVGNCLERLFETKR